MTTMKVLVTGARGKVGSAAAAALAAKGHDVRTTDRTPPVFERGEPGDLPYVQADLTDAGDAFSVTRGMDAVVHSAAIPEPSQNTPHTVFRNNLMATFNVVEACVRWEVSRLVNVSSETVPGFSSPSTISLPDYVPVDEEHPVRPQDPYALSKHFGEQLCEAAVRRPDLRCISIRPCWVQWEGNYERNLGPQVRDAAVLSPNFWSYIDAYDLADALVLAVGSDLPGLEVIYIASPDNVGGRPFAETVRAHYGDAVEVRATDRPDASGISCAKARRLLGWEPKRSWRDYLDANGHLLPTITIPPR